MENLPTLLCIAFITLGFVVPMWAYINFTERRARIERDKAIEAGRHEPVTIQPYVDLSVCMGSGACVPSCPEDVLKVIEGQAVAVNMAACIGHGACVTACPVGAIELVFGSEKRGIDIPRVGPDFQTNIPGVYIAGELGGMGLIASAAGQGIEAVTYASQGLKKLPDQPDQFDIVIVGAGPAGLAAAAAAKKQGISYALVDQEQVGGAVRHYPRKKLVLTRPMDIPGYGRVNLTTLHKEELVELFENIANKLDLGVRAFERVDRVVPCDIGFEVTTSRGTLRCQRVILALGRRGTPRKLDVAGEEQEKVAYSLLEPDQYQYDHLLVVGGGDSAVEAALQLSEQPGNKVFLSYRGNKINRPKEKNVQKLREAVKNKQVDLLLESKVKEISPDRVILEQSGAELVLPNDHVFVMVGGVLPTRFLKDIGIKIQKHYGKRIEAIEDDDAPKESEGRSMTMALPAEEPTGLPFIQPPSALPDPTLPITTLDEPTVALAPEIVAEALAMSAPAPAPEPPRPQPRPASGLAMLHTGTLPVSQPVDELPSEFAPPPARGRKEVTEIQPLKKVSLGGASGEETVSLPDGAPEPPLPDRGEAGPADASPLGRVVARRPSTMPPPPRSDEIQPASPISAHLSRVTGRGPGLRTGSVPSLPGEARPDPRPNPATGRPAAPPRPASRSAEAPPPESPPEEHTLGPLHSGSERPDVGLDIEEHIAAARAALAAGEPAEVLRITERLSDEVAAASSSLSDRNLAVVSRWVYLLEGEAHLATSAWDKALEKLQSAVDVARSLEAPDVLGQSLAALGRAAHQAGDLERSDAALEEALFVSQGSPAERTVILRLLGDQALRRGEIEIAEQHWNDALTEARLAGSADAEAMALRGLANCAAVRGHYPEALEHLIESFQVIGGGDPQVAASVLVRIIELENVLGRYGAALRRSELLMQLTSQNNLPLQRAEGLALIGEIYSAVGLYKEAAEAASRAATAAAPLGQRGIFAAVRAARVLCDAGRPADALALLDRMGDPPESPVDDVVGQVMAVRARALVRTDATTARELANEAVARPQPAMAMRAARIRLDAALALHESGANSAARTAVKRGLKVLQGSGNKGLKLELLIAMYLAAPDHRVVEAAARTALRVMEDVPEHAVASFRSRNIIGEALSRWGGEETPA